MLVKNRLFGSTCLSHLQGSMSNKKEDTWPLKIGPICSPETSVFNNPTLRNNTEDGKIQALSYLKYLSSHFRFCFYLKFLNLFRVKLTFLFLCCPILCLVCPKTLQKSVLTSRCCQSFCSACPGNLRCATVAVVRSHPSDGCTTYTWKVRPLKIQMNPARRPCPSRRVSGTPKTISSLLAFSFLRQLSFLVLIPKNWLKVGVTVSFLFFFLKLKI